MQRIARSLSDPGVSASVVTSRHFPPRRGPGPPPRDRPNRWDVIRVVSNDARWWWPEPHDVVPDVQPRPAENRAEDRLEAPGFLFLALLEARGADAAVHLG